MGISPCRNISGTYAAVSYYENKLETTSISILNMFKDALQQSISNTNGFIEFSGASGSDQGILWVQATFETMAQATNAQESILNWYTSNQNLVPLIEILGNFTGPRQFVDTQLNQCSPSPLTVQTYSLWNVYVSTTPYDVSNAVATQFAPQAMKYAEVLEIGSVIDKENNSVSFYFLTKTKGPVETILLSLNNFLGFTFGSQIGSTPYSGHSGF